MASDGARWAEALERAAQWVTENRAWPRSTRNAPIEERRIYSWVWRQSRAAAEGQLSDGQIATLDQFLPGWNVRQLSTWEEHAEELKRWVVAHAGRMPRVMGGDDQETRVGQWLSNQRSAARGNHPSLLFTEDRRRRLDAILPGWEYPPIGQHSHRSGTPPGKPRKGRRWM